jgi:uncharacterized protein (DUF433 family)
MPTQLISTRLPAWLGREVRDFGREYGRGPSTALRLIVEEWWTRWRLPDVEFREDAFGRRPAVQGGPEVWEIVSVWRGLGEDRDALRRYFEWLDPGRLDQALEYYERFRDEVDATIAENERIAARLLREGPDRP